MLLRFPDFEQKSNFAKALVFYSICLLINFILMGFIFLFGILTGLYVETGAYEFTYNVSRIITPILMILISSYICYKKNILSQMNVILLILLSAFISIFLLATPGLLIPAYFTTK